mgnify:CR=1 FL=1
MKEKGAEGGGAGGGRAGGGGARGGGGHTQHVIKQGKHTDTKAADLHLRCLI